MSLNQYLVDEVRQGMRKGRWREGRSQDPYMSICIKVLLWGSATDTMVMTQVHGLYLGFKRSVWRAVERMGEREKQ